MEQSGLDSAIISGMSNESLEALKASAQNNPTLMRELVTFLKNGSPDPKPITQEEHPVFYDALKNPATYHYVPKSGMGIQKDGHKLHMFNYEVGFQNRSKELFGSQIEEAIDKIKEARASSQTSSKEDPGYKHICALESIIVAAYSDLVINGNDDMGSYLYLCQKSLWALSKSVEKDIGHLAYQGGVVLGLVTEQVASSVNSDELFKAAMSPREEEELEGIEALNEDAINKVYAFLTPSFQTLGILLNNNVDITAPWAGKLIESCPTLDHLCNMKLDDFNDEYVEGSSNGEKAVLEQMYAGMLGSPINTDVPPVRKYILENGQSLKLSELLEEKGHNDLSAMSDKDIYNFTDEIKKNIKDLTEVKGSFGDTFSFVSDLMGARQSAMNDKIKTTGHQSELKKPRPSTVQRRKKGKRPNASLGRKVKGAKLGAAAKIGSTKALASAGKAAAVKGALTSGLGAAGAASAMMGPIGVALAVAPILKSISDGNEQRLLELMSETSADRGRLESEVADLLEKVNQLSHEEDQAKQSELAKEIVQNIKSSNTLKFSKMKGMGLQKDLEALTTNFGSTDMAALKPHSSDADLVAAVDSGRALTALALFVDDDEDVMTPQRSLLQTPRYVKMMSPSCPFNTRTHRTTSEKESMSFITKTSHSGFSTAEKTASTSSHSKQGKVGGIFSKMKVTNSSANTAESENTESYANDEEHKKEEKVKVTQAIMSEYIYMPMKSFSLKEGGLMLSDYAYYRLQKILKTEEQQPDGTWKEVDGNDYTKKYKAMRFLRDFGSHIPFGVQTLGGAFIRTMKITTKEETALTSMYSAAAEQLTKTNSNASKKTTDVGANVGLFGIGAGSAQSNGFSTASSNGSTQINTSGTGEGEGSQSTHASFQSTVTCFGPNAATQDMMYQQIMSNNATWTIIDRGEPTSYFAVWDLIDYIGQGGLLKTEANLLREVWQESALTKTGGSSGNNALLSIIMDNYESKKTMYDFVDNLVDCIVPTSPGIFTREIADQFEAVVRAAAVAQAGNKMQDDPEQFIEAGFEKLKLDEPNMKRSFAVVKDIPSYKAAELILLNAHSADWANHFSYYSGTFNSNIMEKAKPNYLHDLYIAIVSGRKQYSNSEWKPLFEALLSPPGIESGSPEDRSIFNADLKRSLLYCNQETGKRLVHYIFESNDIVPKRKIYHACPEALSLGSGDKARLKKLFCSKKWRLKVKDDKVKVWTMNSLRFFGFVGDDLTPKQVSKVDVISSKSLSTEAWLSIYAFIPEGGLNRNSSWGGRKDEAGEMYIGLKFPEEVSIFGYQLKSLESITTLELQYEHGGTWYTIHTTNHTFQPETLTKILLGIEGGKIQDDVIIPAPVTPKSEKWRIKSKDHYSSIWDLGFLRFIDFDGADLTPQEPEIKNNVIASGSHESYPASGAFNVGNDSWGGRKDEANEIWIGLNFQQEVSVGGFQFRSLMSVDRIPHTLQLQYESNGEWITAYTVIDFKRVSGLIVGVKLKYESKQFKMQKLSYLDHVDIQNTVSTVTNG